MLCVGTAFQSMVKPDQLQGQSYISFQRLVLAEVCKIMIISCSHLLFLQTVPVIVLFTKADMLDAQMIEHLVNTGMDFEDAAMKAPEESVAWFQKKFGQQLYKTKYPPKDHIYFRGVTSSSIFRQLINCI